MDQRNKLGISRKVWAFTLTEVVVVVAITSAIIGVTLSSSIALQKSFNAVDNYFEAQQQQIRIVDYLARDVRRGLSVVSSVDTQTITITIPKYIYQAGDPDLPSSSLIGTPRPAKRLYDSVTNRGDPKINYGDTTSTVVYSVQGSSIQRTQDGVVTTIADSADNLVPQTTDIELANTEYTTTAVTFEPISVADRSQTVVYSTSYLRNRRRPTPTPAP